MRAKQERQVAACLVALAAGMFCSASGGVQAAQSGIVETARAHVWSSRGGITRWHLNQAVLGSLGIRIAATAQEQPQQVRPNPGSYRDLDFAALDLSVLEFLAPNGLPRALTGGALQHAGGFVLEFPGGRADLRGFALRPHGGAPFALDVVDRDGRIWFTLDHGHYLLEDRDRRFALRHMNLRISAYFAKVLQRPEFAHLDAGGMDVISPIAHSGFDATAAKSMNCNAPWPGQDGAQADIQMIYQLSDAESGAPDGIHFERCGSANGSGGYVDSPCTATSTDRLVVIAPDSSLQNVGTAAVPWYGMFSGVFPPYGNDQHPYLVWNLYRMEADGGLRQIAASGVKHAFATINKNCGCSDYHISYPTCQDSYSSASNDERALLGPRSEIVPASGVWARCGSVFDADCDGVQDNGGGAPDDYRDHLAVLEADIAPELHRGATWYFEYWYIVRDAVDLERTMGRRSVTFAKIPGNGGDYIWTVVPETFTNGPVVNAWVAPSAPPPGAQNSMLTAPEGHARVAVKTSALGGGWYRYDYAVMNLDFARAVIDPAHASEPNLSLLSDLGFSRFSVPLPAWALIDNVDFSDRDDEPANDWSYTRSGSALAWQAPNGNELNWGTTYRFSFTANAAPDVAEVDLGVATSGSPPAYGVASLAPTIDPASGDSDPDTGFIQLERLRLRLRDPPPGR